MAWPPADSELDFGKIVVIDKSHNATENVVCVNCRADSARKIFEETATDAEQLLLYDIQSAVSIIDVDLEHPVDVYVIEGNRANSIFMLTQFERVWFPEIRAKDCKLLHNKVATYLRCVDLKENIDKASSLTSTIIDQIQKQQLIDTTIEQMNIQLDAAQGSLAVSLMSQLEADIKKLMRNAW